MRHYSVAIKYRRMMMWLGLAVLSQALAWGALKTGLLAVSWPALLVILAPAGLCIGYAVRLAAALRGWGDGFVCLLLLLLPMGWIWKLAVLGLLHHNASQYLRAQGVQCGFLGPTPTTLSRLRATESSASSSPARG